VFRCFSVRCFGVKPPVRAGMRHDHVAPSHPRMTQRHESHTRFHQITMMQGFEDREEKPLSCFL
jgi:hypothetical protein